MVGPLLRLHEEAFRQLGGVPREILYDRMKTVWLGTDERGEVRWHPPIRTIPVRFFCTKEAYGA
jgi:transposase